MSTVLRAYGDDFDVDAFLVGCSLPVCAVKRRGDLVFPASQPHGRKLERSGVHVSVSDAGFDDFPTQVNESIAFLKRETEQILRLRKFPGVDRLTLDFGIERRDVAVQCDYLPPDLVKLAGTLGLGIELSQYPSSHDDPDAEQSHATEPAVGAALTSTRIAPAR